MILCEKDSDCHSTAPCYSTYSIDKKLPRPEFKELDAHHVHSVASQVTFEKTVTNAVKAVTPRYDYLIDALEATATNTKPSGHFSSVSANAHSCPIQVTSLEVSCGLLFHYP